MSVFSVEVYLLLTTVGPFFRIDEIRFSLWCRPYSSTRPGPEGEQVSQKLRLAYIHMANRRFTDRFHAVKLTVKAKRPISGRPMKSKKNN